MGWREVGREWGEADGQVSEEGDLMKIEIRQLRRKKGFREMEKS